MQSILEVGAVCHVRVGAIAQRRLWNARSTHSRRVHNPVSEDQDSSWLAVGVEVI